mgnify:CR=1 FL=1
MDLTIFADFGAKVIKVEAPSGDPLRREPPLLKTLSGELISSAFMAFNTNKFGVTLDLAHPHAADVCKRLVNTCDICIESFAPNYLSTLGLGYDDLMRLNDTLIMLSITYYGQTGPYAQYKGDDFTSQAIGGFLHAVTGSSDKPPMGTVLEGEWDEVMEVVKRCYETMRSDCKRITCSVKIDYREGKKGRLKSKMASVEEKLGTKLKT